MGPGLQELRGCNSPSPGQAPHNPLVNRRGWPGSSGLLVKPSFFSFLQRQSCRRWGRCLHGKGCVRHLWVLPQLLHEESAQWGAGSGPRGDCAPAGFMISLAEVKGGTFTASTTLSSHWRIPTAGSSSGDQVCPQPCSAAGGSGRWNPPPPGVNESNKTKGNSESRGVPVPGTGDDGYFRHK